MAGAAKNHDYHILPPDAVPIVSACSALLMAAGAVMWMHGGHVGKPNGGGWLFIAGVVAVLACMYSWWAKVIGEAHRGDHTPVVQLHLRYGMILFIASEVMFFVGWFWAFFDFSLFPSTVDAVGGTWPPKGVEVINPFGFPLLNTLILLCSGTTVTWAHHALIHGDRDGLKKGLWATILLGDRDGVLKGLWLTVALGALSPALLPLTLAKPNVGLPLLLAAPTRRRLAWCAAIVAVSSVVLPSWVLDWLRNARHHTVFVPALVFPGTIVLLAAWRWRDPRARLLLLTALMPQRAIYDQLGLWLVARSWQHALLLSVGSWITLIGWRLGPTMVQRWIVVWLYLPSFAILVWPTLQPLIVNVSGRVGRARRATVATVPVDRP